MADCHYTFQNCGAGCWNENDTVFDDGVRHCVSVGEGFFSGNDDNNRHACSPGSYSGGVQSEQCSVCPAGSASGGKVSECTMCPAGFYQELPGQSTCKTCNAAQYAGPGSNAFEYDLHTGAFFCSLAPSIATPSMLPSLVPSIKPSLLPTLNPNHAPSTSPTSAPSINLPSVVPSVKPSLSPTLSPSRAPSASHTSTPSIMLPSVVPSVEPSLSPTLGPRAPWKSPTSTPSIAPSMEPVVETGFYLQVTFASIVTLCCGLLVFTGLVYLCFRCCFNHPRTLVRKAQVEAEVAIATMEEGMFVNGDDATDEKVSKNKGGVHQCDVREAQVIRVVEVHDAMVVDAVVVAPTSINYSTNTTMHIADAAALAGVI